MSQYYELKYYYPEYTGYRINRELKLFISVVLTEADHSDSEIDA